MNIKFYKLNIREAISVILLCLFIFNEILTQHISSIFSYIDDFAIVLIILFFIIKIIRQKGKVGLERYERKILYAYIIIYCLGIIGNLISRFQDKNIAILIDMLAWTKFFIGYICLVNLIKKDRVNVYYDYLIKIAKVIVMIGLVLEILNLTTDIQLVDGYEKYGIKAFSLGGHPSFTSAIFAGFTVLFLLEPKKNKSWICLSMLLVAATLRSKGIAFVCLVIYALIFLRKNISVLKIATIGLLAIIVGWNQIQYYFLNENVSRARALNASIEIANDYLPIGSGFATFGTIMSGKYYSDAYEKYGLSERWGFTQENYGYISDGGWATIIGQFGYLGAVLFVFVIIFLILSLKNRLRECKNIIPYISIIIYMLISSTNETAFSSNFAVFYAILLSIMVLKRKERKEGSIKKIK